MATLLPTFTWTGVTGETNYEFQLYDETTGWIVRSVVGGTSWTPSQPLNAGDNYAWWVGTIGPNNKITWDSPLSFKAVPTPIGPKGTIATLLPTFTWTGVTGVTNYEVQVYDGTTGQIVALYGHRHQLDAEPAPQSGR